MAVKLQTDVWCFVTRASVITISFFFGGAIVSHIFLSVCLFLLLLLLFYLGLTFEKSIFKETHQKLLSLYQRWFFWCVTLLLLTLSHFLQTNTPRTNPNTMHNISLRKLLNRLSSIQPTEIELNESQK